MAFHSLLLQLALGVSLGACRPHTDTRDLIDYDEDFTGSFVTLPIIHGTNEKHFGKRAVEAQLANRSDVAYYAKLQIGTPPQDNYVQLDTGSFELWVNPDCSILSGSDVRFCQAVGSYDPSLSSTATVTDETNSLRYGIGAANVTYVIDDMNLAGSSSVLKQIKFGTATGTEDQFAGIMGIGFGQNITIAYPNFIDELQNQGITQRKAFAVGLGSKDEQEGAIIFGGIDQRKYSGALAKLPIVPAEDSPDGVPRYWVNMNSLSLTPPSGRTRVYENTTTPVFLDTGATLTLLPPEISDAIAADFGSTDGVDQNGFYPVGCDLYDLDGTLDFAFDGITIRVPYNEMIRKVPGAFTERCFLGVVPNEDFLLLGDTFMRSAYVVFDLSTSTVYMQQYTNCGSQASSLTPNTNFAALPGLCSASTATEGSANATTTADGGVATVTATRQADTNGSTSAGVGMATRLPGWAGVVVALVMGIAGVL